MSRCAVTGPRRGPPAPLPQICDGPGRQSAEAADPPAHEARHAMGPRPVVPARPGPVEGPGQAHVRTLADARDAAGHWPPNRSRGRAPGGRAEGTCRDVRAVPSAPSSIPEPVRTFSSAPSASILLKLSRSGATRHGPLAPPRFARGALASRSPPLAATFRVGADGPDDPAGPGASGPTSAAVTGPRITPGAWRGPPARPFVSTGVPRPAVRNEQAAPPVAYWMHGDREAMEMLAASRQRSRYSGDPAVSAAPLGPLCLPGPAPARTRRTAGPRAQRDPRRRQGARAGGRAGGPQAGGRASGAGRG